MAFSAAHFEALEAAKGLTATASNIARLAKGFGPEIARWAFSQWELRKRAKAKFEKAEEMLFDRDGLEMATSEELAWFHATRFPEGALVADLTCGIGADLIALAKNGPSIGYELDPVRAEMARHNLQIHGLEAEVIIGDSLNSDWCFRYAFADPSRRKAGAKLSDPAQFSPNPSLIAKRMRNLDLGIMKLSPMLPDDYFLELGGSRTFVSRNWECPEVLVSVGKELHYHADNTDDTSTWAFSWDANRWLVDIHGFPGVEAEAPSDFLFEADPAAIRGHLLGKLCGLLRAKRLGASNGYLTAEHFDPGDEDAGWIRTYRVLDHGRADEKRIRESLRRLDARVEAVKVRGVKEDPIHWKKKLAASGSRKLVLVLYPVGKSVRFALVEPVAPDHSQ